MKKDQKRPSYPIQKNEAAVGIQNALQKNSALTDYKEAARYPEHKLVIVTCMDARIDLKQKLGIRPGEAHILRNAGGVVTEDTIRSLLLSIHVLGTDQVMVIAHTDCGLAGLDDATFRDKMIKRFGTDTVGPEQFHGFHDLHANVKEQVQKIRSHPWIPNDVIVEGFIADIKTGKILGVE